MKIGLSPLYPVGDSVVDPAIFMLGGAPKANEVFPKIDGSLRSTRVALLYEDFFTHNLEVIESELLIRLQVVSFGPFIP